MSNEHQPDEPSMEEILASIRQIISNDDAGADNPAQDDGVDHEEEEQITDVMPDESDIDNIGDASVDEILNLTDAKTKPAVTPDAPEDTAALVDATTERAAQETLEQLSALIAADPDSDGFEDMVRELIRPMIKAYLDDNLPHIVREVVATEVARIARKR